MTAAIRISLLLWAVFACACSTVGDLPITQSKKKIPFSLAVVADSDLKESARKDLKAMLKQELQRYRKSLQSEQFQQPRKIAHLERQLLQRKLEAEGYYGAVIQLLVTPELLRYQIASGQRFRVAKVTLQSVAGIPAEKLSVSLNKGDPLLAQAVLDARQALESQLRAEYCLLRVKVDYRVLLDRQNATAQVRYTVVDSPQLAFGEVKFLGLTTIEPSYFPRILPFKQGDCFKRHLLDRVRLALLQTNLVASVQITEKQPENGQLPVEITVQERAHKTMTLGAGFESDEGLGVAAGWEHRNLFGKAEKLSIDTLIAEQARRISADLTIPNFTRHDQTVTFYTEFSEEVPDAFESETGSAGVEMVRQFTTHLRVLLGVDLALSRVSEDGDSEDYALLSVPLNVEMDYRDDPLDPTRGWVAALNLRPYWDGYDSDTRFLRSTLAASTYLTMQNWPARPTFALRAALGSIGGIERLQVPANIRFYSGGGGSVRGYPYQSIGPLDDEDEPSGGLSFSEISFESRYRIGDQWGVVAFVDAGSAFAGETPSWDGELLWSAGLGLRYYSNFAPIRLDVGAPLDKRSTDSDFQVYVSIGQAF